MTSKNFILLASILSLLVFKGYSQQSSVQPANQQTLSDLQSDAYFNWKDTTRIPRKKKPQQNEYLNNRYPYPAKPRSQWEFGLNTGYSFIIGDVASTSGIGGGFSFRKGLDHTFSVRFDYQYSQNTGYDNKFTNAYNYALSNTQAGRNLVNDPWLAYNTGNAATSNFVANYQTSLHSLATEVVISLNNKSYYRGNPKTNLYTFVGYGLVLANVSVNALNGTSLYNFSSINSSSSPSQIQNSAKALLDGSFESNGVNLNGNRGKLLNNNNSQSLNHALTFGAGIAFKLGSRGINLGLEQKMSYVFNSTLDGLAATNGINNFISYSNIRLSLPIGNKAKRTQPTYWINPNNYVYSELNKPQHMKIPDPVLPDADGDGVTNQFDLEPSTVKGSPVDTHGVSKDSDGDGVPDYKDKELLTPQKCFPVDADGVGNCPEPPCCTELRTRLDSLKTATPECNIGNLPSIQFKASTFTLNSDAQAMLNTAASIIKSNPACKVKAIGYGASTKQLQQLSWERVNAIINYLSEKQGISRDRFIFTYGSEGNPNSVDLLGTLEEGPNSVPAPHPNLKK